MLPWGLKPLLGVLSDTCPVLGYRKLPYLLLFTAVGLAALLVVALAPVPATPRLTIVVALMLATATICAVDLLSEAKWSERLRSAPASGPALMTFVWGGITAFELLVTLGTGHVIETLGPQVLYLAAAVPLMVMLPLTGLNYLDDRRLDAADVAVARERVWAQPETLVLTAVLTGAVCAIGAASLASWPGLVTAWVTAAAIAAVGIGFLLLLRPVIGRMAAFGVLQTTLAIGIDGATFYFYTDTAEQFPGGPNFDIWFYTTGMGLMVACANLLGMWSYYNFFHDWSYRSLLVFANVLIIAVHLFGVLIYSRTNLEWGIPDRAFAIGTVAAESIVSQWMWIPHVLLLAQCCPVGLEGIMYALLAGCHNVGRAGAYMIGAHLLTLFEVSPRGAVGEAAMFDNLWKVALIAALLPAVTIFLIPYCIPDAAQTAGLLLEDRGSATAGSPWSRWRRA